MDEAARPLAAAVPVPRGSASAPAAPQSPEVAESRVRAWLVVLVVGLNSAMNAYLSITTASSEEQFAEVLLGSRSVENRKTISDFYSYFLFTVMFGMTPGMLLASRWEGPALCISICVNVASMWLRWFSVRSGDYSLCLASVILGAVGATPILSLPPQVSHGRFEAQWRTLTTSLMVEANYIGWLLGALIPPLIVKGLHDVDKLEGLCLGGALLASPLPLVFFACYRGDPRHKRGRGPEGAGPAEPTPEAASDPGGHGMSGGGGFSELFWVLATRPGFTAQVLSCGLLGGIGFAYPSIAIFVLGLAGFAGDVSSIVNVAFIGTGIIAGIAMGRGCSDSSSFGRVLKALFALCAASLAGSAALAAAGTLQGGSASALAGVVALAAASGLASIGFVGVGIEACALYPVAPGYVCWLVELIIQLVGGALNLRAASAQGFLVLACTSLVAAVLMFAGYRKP